MLKISLKYCFLFLLFLQSYPSNFRNTSAEQNKTSSQISKSKNIKSEVTNFYFQNLNSKNNYDKVGVIKKGHLSQKRKLHYRPIIINKFYLDPILLNVLNQFHNEYQKSKNIDLTNHCCLTI